MHFMEVNVEEIDSFRFTLPVHFIGLDGEEMLQFTVEFGESMMEKGNLVFNEMIGLHSSVGNRWPWFSLRDFPFCQNMIQ